MNSENVEQSRMWKETRRLRAWELVQQGWKQTAVAEALGVTRGALSQWVGQARAGAPKPCGGARLPAGNPS